MNVVLSCGGTGGHIYPAIAIADKIKEKNPEAKILFIGTKKGMENRIVPEAGYEIKQIDASGFNRKNLLANVKTIENMVSGSRMAKDILAEFKPDFVIGTGGYVTGTVLYSAHRMGIPCYIHEQNAVPGMANKMISSFAEKVFISFEGTEKYFKHPERVVYTGNPIRSDFSKSDREECRRELGIASDEKMILATGGSLGAEVLNREVMHLVDTLKDEKVRIFFVSGKRYYDNIVENCPKGPVTIIDYANNMPQLMMASDLIISRAGAIAVSEILACGRASVLIPSPNVTNNHQYFNAKAVADTGAAILLEEKNLNGDEALMTAEIKKLLADETLMKNMSLKAKEISTVNAADEIFAALV